MGIRLTGVHDLATTATAIWDLEVVLFVRMSQLNWNGDVKQNG